MEDKKLTKAELIRKEKFEKLSEELEAKGYKPTVLTISIVTANIFSIVVLVIALIIFGFWFLQVNALNLDIFIGYTIFELLLFLIGMFACIVIHELVHGITWAIFCKKHFKSIEFGVMWQMLTPYCTCGEPLKRSEYLIGALMPLLVVGIIPTIVSIYISNALLFIIGITMIAGASGDIMCAHKLITFKETGECIYYDHPYEAGMVVFEKTM